MKMLLFLALGMGVLCCAAWAQERPAKKLIEYGWDVPYPEFVQQNIRQMEERPFHGLIFRLRDFNHAFDTRPWKEADLQPQLEALSGIKWEKFTDNFLCLYAANEWGMDWFNDEHWQTITANLRLYAKAAKVGGCVGICFDPEPYGSDPWAFSTAYPDRPVGEVAAQVRRRGVQFMAALDEELPGLRVLTLFAPPTAFLDGMVDAAGPGVRIIDGNESSYYYTRSGEYFRAARAIRQGAGSLVGSENRGKYASHVEAGMAVYMDQVLALRQPQPAFLSYYLTPEERLRWLEHNVYYALTSTDEYVWCYGEQMSWWGNQVPEGAEEAIRSARAKVGAGLPLGFSIGEMIKGGQAKWEGRLAGRVIQRQATLRRLTPDEKAPEIDGRLDDATWQEVPPLEPFLPVWGDPEQEPRQRAEVPTTAWVTYDDNMFYVAFRCAEPHPEGLRIVGQRKDDAIWTGDDVELLFSTSEEPWPYVHFIVNPRNVQWDGECIEGVVNDVGWDAGWQSATHIGETEWTAELAIPWDPLGGRPKAGAIRRANLCRIRAAGELSIWSMTLGGFLEPERFGVWEFSP